ncbi:hypothetical protein GW17_00058255 [Ensete ventricosum]|nr:hypothetical protein GW17_00058255 [Ensete ventricosum]
MASWVPLSPPCSHYASPCCPCGRRRYPRAAPREQEGAMPASSATPLRASCERYPCGMAAGKRRPLRASHGRALPLWPGRGRAPPLVGKLRAAALAGGPNPLRLIL